MFQAIQDDHHEKARFGFGIPPILVRVSFPIRSWTEHYSCDNLKSVLQIPVVRFIIKIVLR